ncbi:class I SAM-dependent methyltransferase [Massilia sp. Root418]|jgi:methylase of polypeptide subunit release factors|uniref:methyltransferase n=1 Tax=Massilia sp. Root418 TaxID=1736532 RepID=UPI0012F64DA4|nr:class I SAM-dependent methyltransferase [Massilia sp. Root418]
MPARDGGGLRLDAAALVQLGQALRAAGYRFTTVTPATHARVIARDPGAAAACLRGVFGWSRPYATQPHGATLPGHVARLIERSGIAVPTPDGEGNTGRMRSALRCSTLDGQLYFHSAYPTSEAGSVFFGPDTYRFVRALRCETAARDRAGEKPPARIADLCCGAGPAAIVLAGRYPQAEVLAIDINRDALELTQVNAELAGAPNVRVVISDLLGDVEGGFDLITANPPYLLDAAQRSYRHGGGELGEGLAVRIVAAALQRLNPGGVLMLYTGVAITGGEDVLLRRAAPLLNAADCTWRYEEIDPDVFGEELSLPVYAGAERIAAVWLTVCKKD